MGLITWWRARKQRKIQKALEKKREKEAKEKESAQKRFQFNYLMSKGLDKDRDFKFIDDLIKLTGDKYLKEVELLLSSTGNGEYLSDKITNEDIPKLIQNIMENLSSPYKLILRVYLGDEDAIMRYIILQLNEYLVKIMLMNRHKINSMNPEYRKLDQIITKSAYNNQQRKQ